MNITVHVSVQAANHPYLCVHSATSAAKAAKEASAAALDGLCGICRDPLEDGAFSEIMLHLL